MIDMRLRSEARDAARIAAAAMVDRACAPVTVIASNGVAVVVSVERRHGRMMYRFDPPIGRQLIKFQDLPEDWRLASLEAIRKYNEIADGELV